MEAAYTLLEKAMNATPSWIHKETSQNYTTVLNHIREKDLLMNAMSEEDENIQGLSLNVTLELEELVKEVNMTTPLPLFLNMEAPVVLANEGDEKKGTDESFLILLGKLYM